MHHSGQSHQKHPSRILSIAIISLLIVVSLFVALKYLGSRYATQIIDQQIQQAGLTSLIHYQKISFNPLTLTPTMHLVSLGNQRAPWLRFSQVSLNFLPVIYPKLDLEFQLDANHPLANDTKQLMSRVGLTQLSGHGRFLSHPKMDNIDSTLTLHIDQMGDLFFNSNLDILNPEFSLHELRSDLFASMAMGQLSAMPIIYGDSIAFHSITLRFKDQGVIKRCWPAHHTLTNLNTNNAQNALLFFNTLADSLGLAPYHSVQNQHISGQLINFFANPNGLSFSMEPQHPLTLATLMQFVQRKSLYEKSGMTLSAR